MSADQFVSFLLPSDLDRYLDQVLYRSSHGLLWLLVGIFVATCCLELYLVLQVQQAGWLGRFLAWSLALTAIPASWLWLHRAGIWLDWQYRDRSNSSNWHFQTPTLPLLGRMSYPQLEQYLTLGLKIAALLVIFVLAHAAFIAITALLGWLWRVLLTGIYSLLDKITLHFPHH